MSNTIKTNWDKIRDQITVLNAIVTILIGIATGVIGYYTYKYSTANSDLKVSFNPIGCPEYAPMLQPNSEKGFDPTTGEAFVHPSMRKKYIFEIWNDGDIKASEVTAEISLKDPFLICLIAFDEQLQPRGTWEVGYREGVWNYCKIKLGLIGSKGEGNNTSFSIVYSYPASLDAGGKTKEENALSIRIDSSSQRKTVKESYSLDYWKQ